jgi:DnaJ-class molecular chaperone
MPDKHPRCELCEENPRSKPHCWSIEFADEDGNDEGYPRAECRHCNAVAELCPDCDGDGVAYFMENGEDTSGDCPTCDGWGVIVPAKEPDR